MNTHEYIETGILELYLMEALPKEEMLEVERLVSSNAALKEELNRIENDLLAYAQASSVEPRPELRATVLSKIEQEAHNHKQDRFTINPAGNQVFLKSETNARYKYLAAASIILLLISGLLNYNFWNKIKDAESEISVLNSNKEELAQQFTTVKNSFDQTLADVAVFRNTAFKTIVMKGIPAMDSTALVKVYWNKNTQEAFLDVSKLPVPDNSKQYQLWALVDGKPIDAGVFDLSKSASGLQKMKLIQNAQAFAVTLEPRGGSVSPTLTAMYVFGNV